MKLVQKTYYDLHDKPDGWLKSNMVVEWGKAYNPSGDLTGNVRLVKCYLPADVWRHENGNVIVRYERHIDHNLYFAYQVYTKDNMPNIYSGMSVGLSEWLLLALGVLLGYDDEEDCLRPFLDYVDENGRNVYVKWTDIPELKENWRICTQCVDV